MARFNVSSDTDTSYLEIDSQAEFKLLWQSNLFQDINQECLSLISDYEEEVLPPEQLEKVLEIISRHRADNKAAELDEFLEQLERLVGRASSLGFPVYFVL